MGAGLARLSFELNGQWRMSGNQSQHLKECCTQKTTKSGEDQKVAKRVLAFPKGFDARNTKCARRALTGANLLLLLEVTMFR
jgi:hypothetical protein